MHFYDNNKLEPFCNMLHFTVVLLLVYGVIKSNTAESISEQKCKEYAEAVNTASSVVVGRRETTSESTCGIVATPLIVGGTKAAVREFPHMALIGFGTTSDVELKWHCGGSLISENYVLTAAHCSASRETGPAQKVRLGIMNLDELGDTLQERIVKRFIKHPDYKPPSKYNDIGLIELDKSVDFTPDVRPACLNQIPIEDNVDIIASGFGKIAYDAATDSSGDLMKVQLKTISDGTCSDLVASKAEHVLKDGIIESIICAGELAGGKDTCQGDSGGPLQIVRKEPYCMYSIVGVTSFGMFCGFKNSPALYTKVSHFNNWIEVIVWG